MSAKISDLTATAGVTGPSLFEIERAATSEKVTLDQVLAFIAENFVLPDGSALKLSNVTGAPQLKRSSTSLMVEANDGSGYANINIQTGYIGANDTVNPSSFRDVRIANTFGVYLSDGVDFGRGLFAYPGAAGIRAIGANSTVIGAFTGGRPLVAKTANYTVLLTDTAIQFTNDGASGAITLSLPPAAIVNGVVPSYLVSVMAAQDLVIDASGTDVIYVGATPTTAGGTATSNTIGSTILLTVSKAGVWTSLASVGWVTA